MTSEDIKHQLIIITSLLHSILPLSPPFLLHSLYLAAPTTLLHSVIPLSSIPLTFCLATLSHPSYTLYLAALTFLPLTISFTCLSPPPPPPLQLCVTLTTLSPFFLSPLSLQSNQDSPLLSFAAHTSLPLTLYLTCPPPCLVAVCYPHHSLPFRSFPFLYPPPFLSFAAHTSLTLTLYLTDLHPPPPPPTVCAAVCYPHHCLPFLSFLSLYPPPY